jgi:hypothetical protein
MCPVCLATAAWIAAAALSAGGLTALVVTKIANDEAPHNIPITPSSKEDHHG